MVYEYYENGLVRPRVPDSMVEKHSQNKKMMSPLDVSLVSAAIV